MQLLKAMDKILKLQRIIRHRPRLRIKISRVIKDNKLRTFIIFNNSILLHIFIITTLSYLLQHMVQCQVTITLLSIIMALRSAEAKCMLKASMVSQKDWLHLKIAWTYKYSLHNHSRSFFIFNRILDIVQQDSLLDHKFLWEVQPIRVVRQALPTMGSQVLFIYLWIARTFQFLKNLQSFNLTSTIHSEEVWMRIFTDRTNRTKKQLMGMKVKVKATTPKINNKTRMTCHSCNQDLKLIYKNHNQNSQPFKLKLLREVTSRH